LQSLADRNGHWPLRVVPNDIKIHNPSEARRNASSEEQTQTIFVACTAVHAALRCVAHRSADRHTRHDQQSGGCIGLLAALRASPRSPLACPPVDAGQRFDKLETIEQDGRDMIPLPFALCE
jgi:hypothetical protein